MSRDALDWRQERPDSLELLDAYAELSAKVQAPADVATSSSRVLRFLLVAAVLGAGLALVRWRRPSRLPRPARG